MKSLILLSSSFAALLLAGCSTGFTNPVAPSVEAVVLRGGVHGGQQPVSGAKVYLYAAGTGGNGGASRSMLNAPGYVTTGSDGSFSITGDYTCQAGDMVYLLAKGGNPGLAAGTNNAKLVLEAALGPCSALSSSTFVQMNEVTTVAAVYALNGFQSGAGYLASGSSTLALRGLANAFGMVNVLVNNATGTVQPQAVNYLGTLIPQTEINSLANVIAPCVNSDGTGSPCASLFAAMSGGAPTDTLGALVTLANAPGVNPTGVYALSTANAPFQPALTAAPKDWSVAVNFGSGLVRPSQAVAIDAYGNAWMPNQNSNGVQELSPNGVVLSTASGGFKGGGMSFPYTVALDDSNNVWVGNYGDPYGSPAIPPSVSKLTNAGVPVSATAFTAPNMGSPATLAVDGLGNVWSTSNFNRLTKFDNNGNVLSGATGFYNTGGYSGIAVDQSNNLWGVSYYGNTVDKISNTGTLLGTYATDSSPYAIAMDHAGNAWVGDSATITELSPTGAKTSGANGYTGGGTNNPSTMAIDGAGYVFALNVVKYNNYSANVNISSFNGSGTALSGANGYTSSFLYSPNGIAVDGSGNVWVSDASAGVVVFVGLGNPTVTPIASAVKNGALASAP